MPQVDRTPEARTQYLGLPTDIANRFDELLAFLETNPHRLPPWCEVKSIGREGDKEAFRARVGAFRAPYVFDGHLVRFTRLRLRKNINHRSLSKT